MADARNFIINSDYPMDMIILVKTADNVANATTSTHSLVIPHGLSFIPLIFGNWSPNADFGDSRNFSDTLPDSSFGWVHVYADSMNIYVDSFASDSSGNPINVYVRVFGFEPSNSQADVPHTNTFAGTFILNSDYGYSKLLKAGVITVPTGQSSIVAHNLGYLPQVMIWNEWGRYDPTSGNTITVIEPYSTQFTPLASISIGTYVSVDNASVKFANDTGLDAKRHYRIYADEIGAA